MERTFTARENTPSTQPNRSNEIRKRLVSARACLSSKIQQLNFQKWDMRTTNWETLSNDTSNGEKASDSYNAQEESFSSWQEEHDHHQYGISTKSGIRIDFDQVRNFNPLLDDGATSFVEDPARTSFSMKRRWNYNELLRRNLIVVTMSLVLICSCRVPKVHSETTGVEATLSSSLDVGYMAKNAMTINKLMRESQYSRVLQASQADASDADPSTTSSLDLLTTRCFLKCIEESMSPEECQEHIRNEIDTSGGHEVGAVDVQIQSPRTPELFDESYWMVEVPVNLKGQMTCDRNDSNTFYPFQWQTQLGPFDVGNVPCQGLTAGQCCLAIRRYGKEALAPAMGGYDVKGNCLACFVHQESLMPVIPVSTTEYQTYEWNDTNELCDLHQYSIEEVNILDDITKQNMVLALSSVDAFLSNPSCEEYDVLLETLYNASTKMFPLSQLIGQMACQYCYGMNDQPISSLNENHPIIQQIKYYLQAEIPSSAVNTVIIYTNEQGEIVLTPKLGSSLADETHQSDEDCNDNFDNPDNGMTGDGESRSGSLDDDCMVNPNLCGSDQFCTAVEEDDGQTFGPGTRNLLKFFCSPYANIDEDCEGDTGKKCNPANAHCVSASNGNGGYYYGGGGFGNGDFPPFPPGGGGIGELPPGFGGATDPLQPSSPAGTCHTLCESDADCASEGRWCGFGLPRVCLDFGKTGDQCNLFISNLNEEIRCNPETHYCRDTWYCVLPDIGGTCAELGPACQNNDEDGSCENYSTPDEPEWFCDPFLQRCKPAYKFCDCCSLSSPWDTCESGTACGTGDQPESGAFDGGYYYYYDAINKNGDGGEERKVRKRNLRSKTHLSDQNKKKFESAQSRTQQQRHRKLENPETIELYDSIDDFGNAAVCRPINSEP